MSNYYTNRVCPVLTTTSPHGHLHLLLFLLLLAPLPAIAQLPNALSPPPPDTIPKVKFDKSMAIVLVVLVVVFFLLGFLSVYTRHCAERRMMRGRFDLSIPIVGSGGRNRGLDPEIIDTFPTFVYSAVKGEKIGRATLECAVCLNEFHDDETLRLIPKCNHVFHPDCIDAWLVNHSTCPVCRANLIPTPGDTFAAVQIQDSESNRSGAPEPGSDPNTQAQNTVVDGSGNGGREGVAESPKVENFVNHSRPIRSRSTGFRIGNLFPRSHSTGHSLVQPGESLERFTLRLPDEVRNRLLVSSTPRRTASQGGAAFARESSVRRGYRTRSVGAGRSYLQYERFGRRGLNWTPPFLSRAGSTRGSTTERKNEAVVEIGERSSDRLFGGGEI